MKEDEDDATESGLKENRATGLSDYSDRTDSFPEDERTRKYSLTPILTNSPV